jgi:transcriptional regulator with XRE-family HTH domain
MRVTINQAVLKAGKSLYKLSTDLGIPLQTVYEWEKNNRIPRSEYLDAICNYLNCGVEALLQPDKPSIDRYSD